MDMALYAIIMAKVKEALIDGGNVTPEEREKIDKLIIDGLGDKYLSDDGTYKDVSGGTTDYENLNNKPSINGNELTGNKTASQLGFSSVASTGDYEDLTNLPTPIMYLSQLDNDTGFITRTAGNLVNYYTKAQNYTKMEVNQMIGNLSTLSVQIVTELPIEDISLNTIYLIKDEGTSVYVQWMYLNNEWANIGSTEIDLTQYYTKIEVSNLLYNKVDKEFGMGLSQKNYTTQEAEKLAGLSNYVLPEATTSVLGGVKIDGTTIVKDSNGVISSTGGSGGDVIDDGTISLDKTWSSEKINNEIEVVGEIANDISIAQKTVNEKLSQCLSSVTDALNYTPAVNLAIPFTPLVNNGINYNETTKLYTLKSGVTYNIESFVRLISYSGYMYYCLYDYTNSKTIGKAGVCECATGINQALMPSFCTITPNTDIDVGVRVTVIGGTQTGAKLQNTSYMNIIETDRIIIDPVEYVNTTQGIEDTPVGHILSQMGKVAPKHYLICDGSTYNITDYPYLSQYIKDQFGTFNFFGGNGTTTFAVPDLRNEFLRGYHGDKVEKLSGEVGVHQGATTIPYIKMVKNGAAYLPQIFSLTSSATSGTINESENRDSSISTSGNSAYSNISTSGTTQNTNSVYSFTIRPTNASVLYCIKYEPTYFMSIQGLIEEIILWEGNIGSSTTTLLSNSINLSDSYNNYDKIGFWFNAYGSSGGGDNAPRPQYREVLPEMINYIRSYPTGSTLSLTWGYGNNGDYTTIQKTSTDTKFEMSQMLSRLLKVVGIKYKTFQN